MKINQFATQGVDTEKLADLLEQLKNERDKLRIELKQEYRKARRYVRAHPEEGVLLAFVSGICAGIILSKLSD